MTDVYQLVTDLIIQKLENGVIPWHKPWLSITKGAFNRVSGRRYSTLNQLLLKHDGEYASMTQWNKLGGKIRKGEKSEIVVFWKMQNASEIGNSKQESTENTDKAKKVRPILRYYRVFHISQVDGVGSLSGPVLNDEIEPDEWAETVFQNYLNCEGVKLEQEISDDAFYSPSEDKIHLPLINQFKDLSEYYSTAFHEACHSTGLETRLNRAGLQKVSFGSETYSKEELIAEIGSACVLSTIGMMTDESICQSAAYVHGWLQALKNDRRLIVSAAGQAEKACRYILDCSRIDMLSAKGASEI